MGTYTQAVQNLYVAYFSRPADPVGLTYWEGVVAANGGSTVAVSAAFSASAEYNAAYAGKSTLQIVDQVYNNLFGHSADAAGLVYWAGLLAGGKITISNVVTQIAAGALGTDLAAYQSKVAAATAFTVAVDTAPELIAYSGTAANASAKAWLAGVTDAATLATAVAGVDAGLTAIVAASVPAVASQTFTLTAGVASVDEGNTVLFSLNTKNVPVGSEFTYTISGISAADVAGGSLTGTTKVGGDGKAVIQVNLVADAATEGAESLTVNVAGQSISATVNDTSVAPAVVVVPQTFALTTGLDSKVGGDGADLFIGQVGQITTLQASDALVGGAGIDTLRVVTDGTSQAGVGGFSASGIEVLEVQSQAVGGTQLGLENVTALQTVRSSSSSTDITLQNASAVVGLEVSNSVNTSNVTLNYSAAAVAGKADVQAVALNAAKINNLTVNGIETVAITTNGTSTISTLASAASTVTFAGSKAITVTNALDAAVTKVDASAATGAVTVTLSAPVDATVTETVIGGAGNDKLTVSANTGKLDVAAGAGDDTITILSNFAKDDSISGGDGKDTLIIAAQTIADDANGTTSVLTKVTSVETLKVSSGNLTVALGAIAQAAGINTISAATGGNVDVATNVDAGGVATFSNGLTVNLSTGADRIVNTANVALTVNAAASAVTAADTLTGGKGVDTLVLTADGIAAGADLSGVTKFESVTVKANSGDSTLGTKVTLGGGTLTGSSSAPASITINASALGEDAVATIDASANDSNESAVIFGGAGADVITGGAGNDVITGGAGNDSVTIGAGKDNVDAGAGDDTIDAASNLTSSDTINGGDGIDTLKVDSVTSADLANVTNVENLQFSGDLTFNSNVPFTTFDLKTVTVANTLTLTTGYTNATTVKLGANDRVINSTDAALSVNVSETDLAGGAIVRSGKGVDVLNVTADNTTTTAITLNTTNLSKVDKIVVLDGGDALAPATKNLAGSSINFTVASLDAALTIDGSALDAGTYTSDTATYVDGRGAAVNWENLTINAGGAGSTYAVNVIGGAGQDTLTGGGANDTLTGGAGDDVIAGGAGNNYLDGGAGNDAITGGTGNDVVLGGDGDDTFNMSGANVLTGEDTIDGGAGTDSISVASGVTNLSFLNTFNVETVQLADASNATTLGSYAQQAGIRNITGTANNDTIDGSFYTQGLTITSGDGVDSIKTGAGADTFVFSGSQLTFADVINAGAGVDTIRLDYGVKSNLVSTNGTAANVTAVIGVVQGVENIVVNDQGGKNQNGNVSITFDASYGTDGAGKAGKANVVTIDGSSLDYVKASSGTVTQETLTVSAGANIGDDIATTDVNESEAVSVIGGAGNDSLTGGGASDTILGGDGDDDIDGGSGVDSLAGGSGRDLISGSAGNDMIDGGAGADIIVGGAGTDVLMGGAGPDVFGIYNVADSKSGSVDTITDFASGSDRIYVKDSVLTTSAISFKGNVTSFEDAQALLKAGDTANGAVFNSTTTTLWIDANNDGTLNANDVQIVLSNVTALTKTDVFNGAADLLRGSVGTRNLTDAEFVAGYATVDPEDTVTVNANQATVSELLTLAAEIARVDVITVSAATGSRDSDDTADTLTLTSSLNAAQLGAILTKFVMTGGITATVDATGMNAAQLSVVATAAASSKVSITGAVALTSAQSATAIANLVAANIGGVTAATYTANTTGMDTTQVAALVTAIGSIAADGISGDLTLTSAIVNSNLTALLSKTVAAATVTAVATGMDAGQLTALAGQIDTATVANNKVDAVSGVAAYTNAVADTAMTKLFAKTADTDDTVVATSMSPVQLDVIAANVTKIAAAGISGSAALVSTTNDASEITTLFSKFAVGATASVNTGSGTIISDAQVVVLAANTAKVTDGSIKGTLTTTAAQFGTLAAELSATDADTVVTVTGTSAELLAIATGTTRELADTLDVDGAAAGVLSLTATQAGNLATAFTLGTDDTISIAAQVGANSINSALTTAPITVAYTAGSQATAVTFQNINDPTQLVNGDKFNLVNVDVIAAFDQATDKIDLRAFGLSGAAQVTDFTTDFTVLRDGSYSIVRGTYGASDFTASNTGNDVLVLWDSNTGSGVGAVNMVGVVLDEVAIVGNFGISNLIFG